MTQRHRWWDYNIWKLYEWKERKNWCTGNMIWRDKSTSDIFWKLWELGVVIHKDIEMEKGKIGKKNYHRAIIDIQMANRIEKQKTMGQWDWPRVSGIKAWILPEGGGVLGLEKGTNCGPTAAERWLSRREMAKKGGLLLYCKIRELSDSLHPIFYIIIITIVYIHICSWKLLLQYFAKIWHMQCRKFHWMLISRGCSWVSMKRGGCKFGDSKTRGCPLSKSGGCSFAVSTQPQRVSAPPPPPPGNTKRGILWSPSPIT